MEAGACIPAELPVCFGLRWVFINDSAGVRFIRARSASPIEGLTKPEASHLECEVLSHATVHESHKLQ